MAEGKSQTNCPHVNMAAPIFEPDNVVFLMCLKCGSESVHVKWDEVDIHRFDGERWVLVHEGKKPTNG